MARRTTVPALSAHTTTSTTSLVPAHMPVSKCVGNGQSPRRTRTNGAGVRVMKVQYWPKSQDHLHGGLFRRRPPNIRSHHKGFALSCLCTARPTLRVTVSSIAAKCSCSRGVRSPSAGSVQTIDVCAPFVCSAPPELAGGQNASRGRTNGGGQWDSPVTENRRPPSQDMT